ncbi:MAG: fused histidine kinase/response regulator [Acidobacteriaceae bacterium]|nr:fused histidine kinase/response regulator [Acidobacteriaceae bacterium]
MRHYRSSLEILTALLALVACFGCDRAYALDPQAGLSRLSRQTWSTDNGLPQNSAHAILQTSDGFLWIATEGGLARFDGYQFRIFDTESSPRLPGNDIRSLLEDQSKALWVGTAAGLTRLMDGQATTYTVADGLPSDVIQLVLQTSDGTLWVLTSGGIAVKEIGANSEKVSFHALTRKDGLPSDTVTAIAQNGRGGIWIGTSQGLVSSIGNHVQPGPAGTLGIAIEGLTSVPASPDGREDHLLIATSDTVARLFNGVITVLASQASLPAGVIHGLIETPEGIWVAGKSGVSLIHPGGSRKFVMGKDLPGSQIYTLFKDREGAVWIGTNAGLARWFGGKMQTLATGGDSSTSAVLALYEDLEGNMWTGTEMDGVSVLRIPLFDIIGRRQGLADETVTSVVQASDRTLWVGTSGGGLSKINLGEATGYTYTVKEGLASDTVLSLATRNETSSRPPELWAGTPDGLNALTAGRWKLYTSSDGLADDFVRSLLPGRDGELWIGTRRGVTRWKENHGTTWTSTNGLASDLVGTMLQDASGDLWIGTLGGLSRMHGDEIKNFTVSDGLPSNTVTALATSPDGTLWVGTKDQGLALRNGKGFFSFAKAGRLPHNIYAILLDDEGDMWLSSDLGIYRVKLEALENFRNGGTSEIQVVSYGTSDGLPALEGSGTGHPSGWKLADGRLCFASRRGVIVFDPKTPTQREFAPPVVLESMTVDGRDASPSEMASIPAGAAHLSFSFAGISLTSPQRVQYRYMLEGFDKDWVEAGTRRVAFYTNLSPARYRFRVSARSAGGSWGEPGATLPIRLLPRFYQTGAFRVAFAILALIALFGMYRLRMRALQSRFAAVGAERNRIAREIHDTLAQGFVAVSVRLEIMAQLLRKQSIDDCREQLDQTRGLVRDSLAEARRSIWDLRSEGSDSMTLPARLARSVQQTVSNGANARFETTGTYRPLDRTIEDEMLRIAQEALANAIRHANAGGIQVRLTYLFDLATLEVVDDGCGFDVEQAPSSLSGHFGLLGMRERAQKIGAIVIMESSVGRGTTIRVEKRLTRRVGSQGKEVPHV